MVKELKGLVSILLFLIPSWNLHSQVEKISNFHIYSTIINPDCGFNISGYISNVSDDRSTHHFTNLQEFAITALDIYSGSIKIYRHGDRSAVVFRGYRDIKKLKNSFHQLEQGKYDIFFITKSTTSRKMTFEIDFTKDCHELKKLMPLNNSDNILLGTMSRGALKQPLNKNSIRITPAYSMGKVRGGKVSINKEFTRIRKFSFGISYRQFSGLLLEETGSAFTNNPYLPGYAIPQNYRFEVNPSFWPSFYAGVHIDGMLAYQNIGGFTYGSSIGLNTRINRFLNLDYGAGLTKTTIEGYLTPIYAHFHLSIGFVYTARKEKEFYRDYKASKKAYKVFKRENL
jgi:hypothetical protein